MTARDPVVILDGARTPMGSFQGELKELLTARQEAALVMMGMLE